MMIYFIENPLNDTVKIGRSKLPATKAKTLSKQCGIELKLLGVIHTDNDKFLEYQLGQRFDYNSQPGYGWFVLDAEIRTYIDKHATEYQDPIKQWRTVRVPATLYEWLGEHKEHTGIPVATIVKIAIQEYKARKGKS